MLALTASFYFTDIESDSSLRGVILPILDFLLLVCLGIWLVHRGVGKRTGRGGADSGFFAGFGDSGDGGAGGDGGGCGD